jgi:hypothetical protein
MWSSGAEVLEVESADFDFAGFFFFQEVGFSFFS